MIILIESIAFLTIKKVDSNSSNILRAYDDMYMAFLRNDHPARLANYWSKNKRSILCGEHSVYIAYLDNIMIGFAMIDMYANYNSCDISQITIEEKYQRNGYGKQLLKLVVKDIIKNGYNNIFYSSVDGDNIASQKTAEYCGFEKIACRIGVV